MKVIEKYRGITKAVWLVVFPGLLWVQHYELATTKWWMVEKKAGAARVPSEGDDPAL